MTLQNDTLWTNFIGGPSLQFAWAEPQDGNTSPADFNVQKSVGLKALWKSGTGGTLSAPDANGIYTATLTGISVSLNGKLLTGGIGYSYGTTFPLTQTNVAGYPTTAVVNAQSGDTDNLTGGLVVVAPNVWVTSTGYTARRSIADNNGCNSCHQVLGPFTDGQFHAGQRNDGRTCAFCHDSNRTNNGWSLDSTTFIHNIHNPGMRSFLFTYLGRPGTGSDPGTFR